MLEKVLRDAAVVPAMEEIRQQKWVPLVEGIAERLAEGWGSSSERAAASSESQASSPLRASLRLVLDFFTWQTLVDSGLSTEEAARLTASWVEASARLSD